MLPLHYALYKSQRVSILLSSSRQNHSQIENFFSFLRRHTPKKVFTSFAYVAYGLVTVLFDYFHLVPK